MDVDEIVAVLTEADGLEAELHAVGSAPASLQEQLEVAHTEAQRAAAVFRRAPWVIPSADLAAVGFVMMGMAMALAPETTSQLITEQVSQRVKADPRKPLDRGARAKRIASVESKLTALDARLSRDDLDTLESAVDAAHAVYRGLAERLTEAEQNASRRTAAIAAAQSRRDRIGRPPPQPPPLTVAGDLTWPASPSAPLSAAERSAAERTLEAQIKDEARQLMRDQAAVVALKAEATEASNRWRTVAMATDRLERLLQSRPAAQAAA